MCASGEDSHRHIFCRINRADALRVLHPMGIGATDHRLRRYIRPPFTPHRRDGNPASLPVLPEDPSEVHERLRSTGRPLGRSARSAFSAGDSRDKSSTIFSAALGAANAGWSFDEFVLALHCPEIPISRLVAHRVAEKGEEQTARWLHDYIWVTAVERVRDEPAVSRPDVDPQVRATLAWALDQPWKSTQGAIDRSVLSALLWGRRRAGRDVFDMSERDIALAAGVSRSAAQASLARLQLLRIEGRPLGSTG